MELAEPVERINTWLKDQYGIDTLTGLPIWRVVFSEYQYEKRFGTFEDFSPGGIFLRRVTQVREVPKYPHIKEKFVLERLTIVPDYQEKEVQGKLSYEPMWVFETRSGMALPPKIDVCRIVIDTVYAASGRGGTGDTEVRQGSMRKYVDELASETPEAKLARIDKLAEDLFGDETNTGDALAYKEGVVVPRNYEG